MLPVIALVGRPNVGKSTLFNRLTATRDALVADQPGLTRDRKYGMGRVGGVPFLVVDTGGLSGVADGIDALMEQQVLQAVDEADHLFLLVDARNGCTPGDEMIANRLRRTGKPVTLVVNKSEGLGGEVAAADFFGLGMGAPVAVSAAHGQGVGRLLDRVLDIFPEVPAQPELAEGHGARIAVVGRPNVGKSTLVNRMLGEERVLAFDQPGTTRDSVSIPFTHNGRAYTLIDTAGVRRRARVHEAIEKFSVIKTLQAIEESNVVLLVLDAHQGIGEQDATLGGHVLESGRALVVAINKWDGLDPDDRQRLKTEIGRKLPFLDFARHHYISALHGSGVGSLYASIDRAYSNAMRKLATPELTRILEAAVAAHQPPLVKGRRIKLRYAHQGGQNPPIIVVHGNQTAATPASYRRYLTNRFREALGLEGNPLRIEFRTSENPYKGRKNVLTQRQQRKRQRLRHFVRRQK
jgi:GTP-binding protein